VKVRIAHRAILSRGFDSIVRSIQPSEHKKV